MRPQLTTPVVERFTTIGEAEASVTALDAGGIEATLFDDEIVTLDWLYSNAVGGIKVVVREEDYDVAADILDFPAEETKESEGETQTGARTPAPHCPSCGLTTITKVPAFRLFACFAVALYGVGVAVHQLDLAAAAIAVVAIALMLTSSHRCTSCGERFD
jgi:hypothetical protein